MHLFFGMSILRIVQGRNPVSSIFILTNQEYLARFCRVLFFVFSSAEQMGHAFVFSAYESECR
jgi:hypothetical protein